MKKYIKKSLFAIIIIMLVMVSASNAYASENFNQKPEVIEQTADEKLSTQISENQKLIQRYNKKVKKYRKLEKKLTVLKNKKKVIYKYKTKDTFNLSLYLSNDSNNLLNKEDTIKEIQSQNKKIKTDNKKIDKVLKSLKKKITKQKKHNIKTQTKNPNWDGPVLNSKNGVVIGPNGKETYYNLNMSNVVANMKRLGYKGKYWVRDDGCKMFGNYIMVAANLKKYPRGSIVDTSLGKGIVCDTGGFASNGSGITFDIATSW